MWFESRSRSVRCVLRARRTSRMGQYAFTRSASHASMSARRQPIAARPTWIAGGNWPARRRRHTVVGDRPVAARRWHGRIMAAVGSNSGGVRMVAATCFGM